MANILLAAELGAGFGHVAPLRAVAQQLISRGHRCTFAVRDLDAAHDYLGSDLGALVQAPLKLNPPVRPLKILLSYASVLYTCGFDEPAGLATRLRAWRQLFHLTRCDYLVADHSPTAILAARTVSLPTGMLGTGFSIPPLAPPFPHFGDDTTRSDTQLAHNDAAVLQVINSALDSLTVPPLSTLQSLFDQAFAGLLTYAELDHYGNRRDLPYLGLPDFSHGVDVTWGDRREPRLFAYLRPHTSLPFLLSALRDVRAQVVVRVSGADLSELSAYGRPGLVAIDRQVHLRRVAESCDAIINYGAHGTTAQMLLSGKPGLLVPSLRERAMVAARAVALGAAIVVPNAGEAPYAAGLARLIEDPALRRNAEAFAQRYAAQDRSAILPRWCEAFLGR